MHLVGATPARVGCANTLSALGRAAIGRDVLCVPLGAPLCCWYLHTLRPTGICGTARQNRDLASNQPDEHVVTFSPVAVVRGAVNTPEAIKEHRSGKQWDQESRAWRVRPTNAIVEDTGQFQEARRRHNRGNGEAGPSGEISSTHFYHVLGVEVCRKPVSIASLTGPL